MRVTIDDDQITIDGAAKAEEPGLTERQARLIEFIRAVTWAMQRMTHEIGAAVSEHEATAAIQRAMDK